MAEHSARILVVDDERFFREAIREILAAEGLVCVEARDGEEALDLVHDPAVGVVVLDIRLPGIDGIEVLRRLRDARPQLRVIMLSASTDQELVLEALRLGACDYLAKPLHDEELVLAVRRASESYGLSEEWVSLRGRLDRLVVRMEDLASRVVECNDEERSSILCDGAVRVAADVLEATKTSIMLLDPNEAALEVRAMIGRAQDVSEMDSVAVGEGVAGLAMRQQGGVVVEDIAGDDRFGERATPERYDSTSFAIAPVGEGVRTLGVLCVSDRPGGGTFNEEDLGLLRLVALQISNLLAAGPGRAAATGEISSADSDAEIARLICEAVVTEVEPDRVIRAVLQPLATALAAAPVSLYLLDGSSGDLVREGECDGAVRAERGALPPNRGLTGTVLQTGHLVASLEPELDGRFDPEVDTPEDGQVGPLLCVPLRLRGKVVGVFRAFPRPDASVSGRTGEVLSAALSAAVRNVLLYRSLVETIEEVAEARRASR